MLLSGSIATSPPDINYKRKPRMRPAKQRAGGLLHVKLMFLIMCEELIRNGCNSTRRSRVGHRLLCDVTARFSWFGINCGFTRGCDRLTPQCAFLTIICLNVIISVRQKCCHDLRHRLAHSANMQWIDQRSKITSIFGYF